MTKSSLVLLVKAGEPEDQATLKTVQAFDRHVRIIWVADNDYDTITPRLFTKDNSFCNFDVIEDWIRYETERLRTLGYGIVLTFRGKITT